MFTKSWCKTFADVFISYFNSSAGIASIPDAFLFFGILIYSSISARIGGFVPLSISSSVGVTVALSNVSGQFSISLKCSTYLLLCLCLSVSLAYLPLDLVLHFACH
jgi:hypothetical protein